MTDLEENCWSNCCCQKCGTKLRGEQYVLKDEETNKTYCSRVCYDNAVRAMISAPIFVAPALMHLREHILRRPERPRRH